MGQAFRSGIYKKQFQYSSFTPTEINKPYRWEDSKIDVLLEDATKNLGALNAYSQLIPDVDYFIKTHIAKEATTSSRIEGTQTSLEEAFLSKDEVQPERRDDWLEVQNYIKAINQAEKNLAKLPLSLRLLNEAHGILLTGARGKHKGPGEIRKSQNWIGGSSLKDAAFIPPHPSELPELLSDLEKYWHNDSLNIPHLIKIAVSHYQIETIHPYQDGNGRLGRLLITLYLLDKKLLERPTLYLSDFFERNRSSYYDSLMRVRTANDIEQWIKFFLVGVSETAANSINTFKGIVKLDQANNKKLVAMGKRAKIGAELLRLLHSHPVVSSKTVSTLLGFTHPATNNLISKFVDAGILEETTGYKRNRMFTFHRYLKLFE